jgi:hypothetical protein
MRHSQWHPFSLQPFDAAHPTVILGLVALHKAVVSILWTSRPFQDHYPEEISPSIHVLPCELHEDIDSVPV